MNQPLAQSVADLRQFLEGTGLGYNEITGNAIEDVLEHLEKLRVACSKLERGCHCEYDYRCGKCSAIVNVHDILRESPL